MKEYIEERAIAIANYIIESNATVRQTAKKFGISKSTVHKDVTERLLMINPHLRQGQGKFLILTNQRDIFEVEWLQKISISENGHIFREKLSET